MDTPETDQNTGRPERGSRQPIFNAPAPVLGFAALLLILHGGFGLLDQAGQRDLIWQFALISERLGALLPELQYPDGLSAALTFVSHAFLHGDWMHVGFNAAWIVAMGVPVWRAFGGGWRSGLGFGLVFAASAVAGGLAFVWFSAPQSWAIGASGGASGLMAAALAVSVRHPEGPIRNRLRGGLVLPDLAFVALNVGVGLFGTGLFGSDIAWQAHIGGYLAGAILFPILRLLLRGRDRQAEGPTAR